MLLITGVAHTIDTEHKTVALRYGGKSEVSVQSLKYSSVSTAEQSRPRSLNFLQRQRICTYGRSVGRSVGSDRNVTTSTCEAFENSDIQGTGLLDQHFLLFKFACDSRRREGKVFLCDTKFHDQTALAFSLPPPPPPLPPHSARNPTLNPSNPHLFRFMVR